MSVFHPKRTLDTAISAVDSSRLVFLANHPTQPTTAPGFVRFVGFINRRKAMKLFAASLVGLAVIASPVLAQAQPENTTAPTNTTATETTNVKSTTKQVHATNVPVKHHHARKHHHALRCSCPPTHMKAHHHHVVKKTTTTETTTKTPG
jgi:hypothetical protein